MNIIKFIIDLFSSKCICGEKATKFPHGIPCCDSHYHDGICSIWLGFECDCDKE